MGKFSKALFIFRRDYRLFDNTGWIAAGKASEKIIPGKAPAVVFVLANSFRRRSL